MSDDHGEIFMIQVAKERKKSMPFNIQHKYFFASELNFLIQRR